MLTLNQFRVPSNEEVTGHIMEYVHGISAFDYGETIGNDQEEIGNLVSVLLLILCLCMCSI